jgi:hypothetical protein
MVEHMKLTQFEFNQRCHEVFVTEETDNFFYIEVEGDKVSIWMSERDQDGEEISFTYEPDMTERPESLDYLLGNRDDFND